MKTSEAILITTQRIAPKVSTTRCVPQGVQARRGTCLDYGPPSHTRACVRPRQTLLNELSAETTFYASVLIDHARMMESV